jgi:hypothetical protein
MKQIKNTIIFYNIMEFVVFIVSALYHDACTCTCMQHWRVGNFWFMPTFDLGCTSGIHSILPSSWFSVITTIITTAIVATPTQRRGCGLPIVVVLQVDTIDIDLEEVSTGGVKPSHRQVDTVHLLKSRENTCTYMYMYMSRLVHYHGRQG